MTDDNFAFNDDYMGDDGSIGAFDDENKPTETVSRHAYDALMINVDRVFSNPQVREDFDDDHITELAASLEHQGQIQPIVVKNDGDDRWLIVSGECRWRAAQKLGWKEIRCDVKDIQSESEFLEIQIAENTHRKNLNPVEKAKAYKRLKEEGGYENYKVIAERFGLDPSGVQKDVKMLRLEDKYLDLVAAGEIPKTYAIKAAQLDDPAEQARTLDAYLASGDAADIIAKTAKKGTKAAKAAKSRGIKRRREFDDIVIAVSSQKRKPVASLSEALRRMADELDAETRSKAA